MVNAMMGRSASTTSRVHPTHAALEHKLLPSFGATAGDMNSGEGESSGFMDYEEDDDMYGNDDFERDCDY
jgi:hypothetical protein